MKILAVQYSPSSLEVNTLNSLADFQWKGENNSVLWLDISEYSDLEELRSLEKDFGLHPLALEDCVHVRQRPKMDDFRKNLFVICRTVSAKDGQYTEDQQLGIFLGKNFVITVHKENMPQLNTVFEDLQQRKPQLVERAAPFLLYAIIDSVVDSLENAVSSIEEMESNVGCEVLKEPPPENVLSLIYQNRNNLLLIGRILRSQSQVANRLSKGELQLVNDETAPFFGDVYDHTQRTLDRIDSLLDINLGSLNIYQSSMSNRMNQVMKLLTVISTIGVPMTILVGWYGMNFYNMPEIPSDYGYASIILVAATLIIGTVLLFKRKGWL
jgi:magnesium transporter